MCYWIACVSLARTLYNLCGPRRVHLHPSSALPTILYRDHDSYSPYWNMKTRRLTGLPLRAILAACWMGDRILASGSYLLGTPNEPLHVVHSSLFVLDWKSTRGPASRDITQFSIQRAGEQSLVLKTIFSRAPPKTQHSIGG